MTNPITKLVRLKRENAQTMVEFALVFPIILLITYGIIEFGRMVFIYASVTSAAREGARYGAAAGDVPGISPKTPYYAYCDGIKEATQRGAILTSIDPDTVSIWYESTPGIVDTDIGSCPPAPGAIRRGYRIGVEVIAYYSPIIPFLGLDQNPVEITRQNARTILVNVQMITPAAPNP